MLRLARNRTTGSLYTAAIVGLFDDDDDSDREPASEAPPPARPLTIPLAVLWFVVASSGAMFALLVTTSLRESASHDLVNAVACQALAYAASMAVMLRVHAPDRPLADAIGLRPTHWTFYLLAALFGIVLQVPADWLEFLVTRVWPIPAAELDDQLQLLRMASPLQRVMVPLVTVCVGPAVEELFYRGVLQSGLRRRYSGVVAVLLVAALFATAHVTPQLLPAYLAIGLALSGLRALSGSLLPSLIAHMFFNAVAIISLLLEGPSAQLESKPLPIDISVVGIGATLALSVIFVVIARRSERAQRARQEDAA